MNVLCERFITGPLEVNTYCFLLSANSLCVIDPGGDFNVILDFARKEQKNIEVVVLTHGHLDHLIALPQLKRHFPQLKLYVHKDDMHYIGALGLNAQQRCFEKIGMGFLVAEYGQPIQEADVLLNDQMLIFEHSDAFPEGLQVIHTPGHTQGSICLYSRKEGLLFSGDTLFLGSCGRTDMPGGNHRQMQKSLALLFELPETTMVYPGHNEFTTILQEKKSFRI